MSIWARSRAAGWPSSRVRAERRTAIRSVESATTASPRNASASPYGDPAARATATWWTAMVRALVISPMRTSASASAPRHGTSSGSSLSPIATPAAS